MPSRSESRDSRFWSVPGLRHRIHLGHVRADLHVVLGLITQEQASALPAARLHVSALQEMQFDGAFACRRLKLVTNLHTHLLEEEEYLFSGAREC